MAEEEPPESWTRKKHRQFAEQQQQEEAGNVDIPATFSFPQESGVGLELGLSNTGPSEIGPQDSPQSSQAVVNQGTQVPPHLITPPKTFGIPHQATPFPSTKAPEKVWTTAPAQTVDPSLSETAQESTISSQTSAQEFAQVKIDTVAETAAAAAAAAALPPTSGLVALTSFDPASLPADVPPSPTLSFSKSAMPAAPPGSPKSPQSMSVKARLDEDILRWRKIALKIHTKPPAKQINDEDYLVVRENFKINREIEFATGNFSKLYKAQKGTRELCCKVTPLVNVNVKYKNHLLQAVKIMRFLSENMHPSVVAHSDIYASCQKLYIFMEFLPGPSLEQIIRDAKLYAKLNTPQQCKKWVRDVAEGINFLYVCGIAHNNVTPCNVMLYNDCNSAKLIGFNSSVMLFDAYKDAEVKSFRLCEFEPHRAPECFKDIFRPVLADVWALGVLLVKLLSKKTPFPSLRIAKYDEKLRVHLHRHHVPMEANLMDFLLKCFIPDPLNRIDIAAILLHPYFN